MATVAVVMLIFVIAAFSYNERLKAAIGYYNTTTTDEISAIEKLSTMGSGTVIVTAKGADRSAGTLYGWIVEGVARRKAVGPGEPYIFLLQKARDDSLNAERVLAGSEVSGLWNTTRFGVIDGHSPCCRGELGWFDVEHLVPVPGRRRSR